MLNGSAYLPLIDSIWFSSQNCIRAEFQKLWPYAEESLLVLACFKYFTWWTNEISLYMIRTKRGRGWKNSSERQANTYDTKTVTRIRFIELLVSKRAELSTNINKRSWALELLQCGSLPISLIRWTVHSLFCWKQTNVLNVCTGRTNNINKFAKYMFERCKRFTLYFCVV